MKYSSDNKFFYVTGDFKDKGMFKDLLNGTWSSKKKAWRFPKNLYSMRELAAMFPALRTNEEFIAEGKEEARIVKWKQDLKNMQYNHETLRSYQAQDVGFLRSNGSSLVLNEPRTGKTPTMIHVLMGLDVKTTLIVTPSSLTYNWKKEIEKFAGNQFYTMVYTGTPKVRAQLSDKFKVIPESKILIVSKDTLKRDEYLAKMKFDVAIVDEAHFLRNYKSAQSKAIFDIQANVKYALTGTPAVKHAVDVYGLLHFIDPKGFPSYWQFAERYFTIDEDMWGKSIGTAKKEREQELKTVMEGLSVQRKRKDVMTWLPKAQKQTLYVKMDKKQLKIYDQMLETFMASMDDNEVDTANKLSQLLRLRQLCLDPRLLGFEKVVGTKTTALLEFVEENNDPFIVMTTFSSYFKLIKPELEKLGKRVGIIDGSISQKDKFKTAEDFQNGHYDILLCNIIASGTGFTLDRADTIIFLDKDFNPANNEQAQDRIVPTSKERYHNINIISLVVDGSIDDRVNTILENKEDLTKIINHPKELIV